MRFIIVLPTAISANANPALTGPILSKYSKLDPALIAGITRAHFADQLTPAAMQPLIDCAAKYVGFGSFPAQELL